MQQKISLYTKFIDDEPGNSLSENGTVRRLHGKDIMPLVVRVNVLKILFPKGIQSCEN